jgi:putative addiction module component (TIGR02574 family)
MEVKNLSNYGDAEKIILAEQLWDSVSKTELIISDEIKNELDIRLQNLGTQKTTLYSWEEVKSYLDTIR